MMKARWTVEAEQLQLKRDDLDWKTTKMRMKVLAVAMMMLLLNVALILPRVTILLWWTRTNALN